MTTSLPHPALRLGAVPHRALNRGVMAAVFGCAAAGGTCLAHMALDPVTLTGGTAVAVASLLLASSGYMRLCGRTADITHALAVGSAWLLAAVAGELLLTSRLGHPWYGFLGSPAHPLLRNAFLFIWIFGPALFVRHEDDLPAAGGNEPSWKN